MEAAGDWLSERSFGACCDQHVGQGEEGHANLSGRSRGRAVIEALVAGGRPGGPAMVRGRPGPGRKPGQVGRGRVAWGPGVVRAQHAR